MSALPTSLGHTSMSPPVRTREIETPRWHAGCRYERDMPAPDRPTITAKLRRGYLPAELPNRTREGRWGSGRLCTVCDRPMSETDIEVEADFLDGRTLCFHRPCFAAWHAEVLG